MAEKETNQDFLYPFCKNTFLGFATQDKTQARTSTCFAKWNHKFVFLAKYLLLALHSIFTLNYVDKNNIANRKHTHIRADKKQVDCLYLYPLSKFTHIVKLLYQHFITFGIKVWSVESLIWKRNILSRSDTNVILNVEKAY